MTVNEILDALRYNDDGELPKHALEEAIAKKEEMSPELIKIIEKLSEKPDEYLNDDRNYFAHIYALFLLASFKEKRAYKPLINLFSMPEYVLYQLFDDIMIDYSDIFMFLVSDGDDSLIKELIMNEDASEFPRAGALRSIKMMYLSGIQSRDEIMKFYKSLFSELKREDSLVWIELAKICTEIYPAEVYDDIKRACEDELINDYFYGLNEADEILAQNKDDVLKQDFEENKETFILDNIIEELEGWMEFGIDYGYNSSLDEDEFDEDDDEFDNDDDEFDEDDDEFDEEDDEFDEDDEDEFDEDEDEFDEEEDDEFDDEEADEFEEEDDELEKK